MGLRLKFSLLVIGLISLVVFFLSWLSLRRMEDSLKEEIALRGEVLARNIAANAEDPLVTHDDLYLARLVTDAIKTKGVSYCIVLDAEGIIRAHKDLTLLGKTYSSPKDIKPLSQEDILAQEYSSEKGERLTDIALPIVLAGVKKIGSVHVGVSHEEIEQAIERTRNDILTIFLLVLLIGVLGAILLSHFLIHPIKALVAGVGNIAGGDFNQKIPVRSRDELGTLTRAFNDMAEALRTKEAIKDAFRRYVSRQVAEEIFKAPDRYVSTLKGERRKIAVLFADIRGFTPLAERLDPEEVVKILNIYLTIMTDIVFKYGGTVDKFMGDCIMAVYGAPIFNPHSTERAVRTAIEIQEMVNLANMERVSHGKEPVLIGIGINSGMAVVGNIGSKDRLDYTVVGDSVNLAARLQTTANLLGRNILISKSTFDEVANMVETVELEPVTVRGKSEPVEVYEILGLKKSKS